MDGVRDGVMDGVTDGVIDGVGDNRSWSVYKNDELVGYGDIKYGSIGHCMVKAGQLLQITASHDFVRACRAMTFAPVPLKTGNPCACAPKRSVTRWLNFSVTKSSP